MGNFARGVARLLVAACAAGCFATLLISSASAADDEAENDRVEEYFQELFLGEAAYPQDAGETQLSLGHFWTDRGDFRSSLPLFLEYGITDELQVGVTLPINDHHANDPELRDGLGNVELEVYWALLNCADTGWVAGIGFGYSLPEATTGAGEDAHIYEPFAVLYRDFHTDALNLSGGLEIEDPRDPADAAETSGEVAVAYIRPDPCRPLVWLLEADAEIESEGTHVRIAPGAYYRPAGGSWELGFSLPVGLTESAPKIGAFAMLTFEFE